MEQNTDNPPKTSPEERQEQALFDALKAKGFVDRLSDQEMEGLKNLAQAPGDKGKRARAMIVHLLWQHRDRMNRTGTGGPRVDAKQYAMDQAARFGIVRTQVLYIFNKNSHIYT